MPSCSNDWPWWLGGHRNAKNNQDKPPILRPDLLNTQAPTRGGHRVFMKKEKKKESLRIFTLPVSLRPTIWLGYLYVGRAVTAK